MNYIGSKQRLLPFLDRCITEVTATDNSIHRFCDIFAGTGVVGKFFKKKGYQIIANDIQYYSFVLNRQYIGNNSVLCFEGLKDIIPEISNVFSDDMKYSVICEWLDLLKPVEGYIFQNYCKGHHQEGEDYRLYFSDENGGKCDAIRMKIEQWRKEGKVTEDEYFFLLATLIENIDKVANTASVYGAFLKKIKKSAAKPMVMKPAEMVYNDQEHFVYNEDANLLAKRIHTDILYMDPPYNHRQYSGNYHLLETIARYDNPQISGKTGMRDCGDQKSDYCSRSKVKEAFRELIMSVDARYIFLSYNNEGLMSFDDIREVMSARGEYGCFEQKYNRFKADKESASRHIAADSTTEYVHYVRCS